MTKPDRFEPQRPPASRRDGSDLASTTRDFLKALAGPTRQRLMLLFAGGAELSVNEVSRQAGIGQSTASQELAILRQAGILAARREGQAVRYRADPDRSRATLRDLQAYLDQCS